MAADGTWDEVLAALTVQADAVGALDWSVAVDSTIARAHQHATNIARHAPALLPLLAQYRDLRAHGLGGHTGTHAAREVR